MRLVTQDGHAYPLRPGDNSVGRSPENTIVLPSISVSRRHAIIRWDDRGLYLVDAGSVNGTMVGGRRLVAGQWVDIQPGMQIQFGEDMICQVIAEPSAPPQRPVTAPMTGIEAPPAQPGWAQAAPAAPAGRWGGLDILFRAVDVSLSKSKLALALGGSLTAVLVWLLTAFLASRLLGDSLVFGALFVILGSVLAWLAFSLTLGALTRMSYTELTGRQPIALREAVRYAGRRWSQFALTPLALLAAVAVAGIAEVAVLLVGRVDYLGELLDSLLFLPAFVLNLFLIAAVAFGSSLVYPIVIDRGRGIAGSLAYLIKLMRAVPGRVVLYLGTASIVTGIATAVLWGLVFAALAFTIQALTAGLGIEKFGALMMSDFSGLMGIIPGLDLPYGFGRLFAGNNPATYAIAGRLLQLGIVIVLAGTLAYPLVLQTSLACAVYLNVKEDVPA